MSYVNIFCEQGKVTTIFHRKATFGDAYTHLDKFFPKPNKIGMKLLRITQ